MTADELDLSIRTAIDKITGIGSVNMDEAFGYLNTALRSNTTERTNALATEVAGAFVESANLPPLPGGDAYSIPQAVIGYTGVIAAAGVSLADQSANLQFSAFGNNVQTLATTAAAIEGVSHTTGAGGNITGLAIVVGGATIREVDLSVPTLTDAFVSGNPGGIIAAVTDVINTATGINQNQLPPEGGIGVNTII